MPEAVTITECAAAVDAFFEDAFTALDGWRQVVAAGPAVVRAAELDAHVEALVVPVLTGTARPSTVLPGTAPLASSPVFVGAGFIAAPGFVRGRDIHFAWFLGPQDGNPLLGSSNSPTRLDLATRAYTDYVRNFRTLEWTDVPRSTQQTQVTGPYVDHLCTCEYIFTLTMPVRTVTDAAMVGVVGADVSVKRLEQAVLPLLRQLPRPALLINSVGRIVVSTDPALSVGDMMTGPGHPQVGYDLVACAGLGLAIASPDRPPRL